MIDKRPLKKEELDFLVKETETFRFLNHPGIIKVKESFENRTHIFIIAELVSDGDLFDYI